MTWERYGELMLEDHIKEWVCPEAAAHFLAKIKRKVLSVKQAKKAHRRQKKRHR